MEFTHSQINTYFYICLLFGLALGGYILYWFGRRAFGKITRNTKPRYNKLTGENVITTSEIGGKTMWYMLPGILLFILVMTPAFFFMGQQKKWNYCIDLIRVNQRVHIKKDDPDVIKRCNCLDKDELFKEALAQ